jgi:hypothetical protein
VAGQNKQGSLFCALFALGILAGSSSAAAADDLLRFSFNVPGDAKPIILHADEMATWIDGGRRLILLKGKVLVEHGVVQLRTQQAVVWIDQQQQQRQMGILRADVYAEGQVSLENGPESRSSPRALVSLYTRGEVKLRSHNSKVSQTASGKDPLVLRAEAARGTQVNAGTANPIRPVVFQEPAPQPPALPAPISPVPTQPSPGAAPVVPTKQTPSPGALPPAPGALPPVAGALPPAPGALPPVPGALPPAPVGPPVNAPSVPAPTPPAGPAPMPSPSGTPPVTIPPAKPPPVAQGPAALPPLRRFSVQPRAPGGFDMQSYPVSPHEDMVVVRGGIILVVQQEDKTGLVDIEADHLVFWTHGNTQEVLNNLRSQQGQHSRELEFYFSGNVEIRQQTPTGNRLIRADEVYYDVARNVAVAMNADAEFREPHVPDPVHMRSPELLQLSPTLFKGMKAELFSSRLPSDPGLKVYVADGTLEEKTIERRSIFGIPFIDRRTGQAETAQQRLFDGRNVFLEIENIPVFYLPFLRGDANDPLGPLESVGFNYNRIYGFQFTSTWNVYDLLGMDPLPNTRWRLDADVLTNRGPALGTEFDYKGKSFLTLPADLTGIVKAYGIYDTGTDQLGGGRGPDDNHPNGRGRLLWQQNVQDLPQGFTLQTQVAPLSDKNFLEQYFKNEFDTGLNQETFAYLKQQQDNWAWTVLVQQDIRNWVTETSWLPRADGYLIGQSFFDIFTYNAHGSLAYATLQPTDVPPPPVCATDQSISTGRFDLMQELSLPFTLGAFRLVPYATLDLTYYTRDLAGDDRGRAYEGGGLRGSIPFTRLYPDIQNELLNLKGINHKIVVSGNYFVAHSDTSFTQLPQLDQLNDNATDQALRDIKPIEPALNPAHGVFLATSPIFDPQIYAIQQLVDNRIDTLNSIEVLQGDIRQRWQTKRGYPGQEHIVDWMTLDLSGTYFPRANRDNFGEHFAFLQYDWTWNVGDRTALVSSGWYDPEQNGPRVFNIGAFLNRPDRTSFYLGYREIDPLNSQAVTGAATYVFSPKYAMTASVTYDFGVKTEVTSLILTRMGSDLQVSLGLNYNSILNTFGVTFEILPNIVPLANRVPGMAGITSGMLGR